MKKITNPKHQITNNLQIPIANKFSVIRIWVLCIVCSLGFVYWNLGLANAGSVQFSTYYPAPFGMYDRLRLVPRAILAEPCDPGAFYYETGVGLKLCDESNSWSSLDGGVWTQDSVNNYIYPTDTAMNPNLKIGIGTTVPNNTLQVSGLVNFNDAKFSTSIGKSAGAVNTGDYNSFFGYQAGFSNTTGSTNTASGSAALYSNVGGGRNTASGTVALYSNTTGSTNTASGAAALYSNVGGDRNTASGVNALFSNTAGTGNTAMGTVALLLNTTGNNNIAIGDGAGDNITTGSRNIVIGADIDAPSATTDNQLSIGNLIFGTGLDGTGTTISTGNVGIGTTTPNKKLHLSGSDDAFGIRISQTQGGVANKDAIIFTDNPTQSWAFGTLSSIGNGNFVIKDVTRGETALAIGLTGTVAIGNNGIIPEPLDSLYIKNDDWGFGRNAIIALDRTSTAKSSGIRFLVGGAEKWRIMPSIEGGGSPADFEIWDTSSARIVIQNTSGNVGIGVTTPVRRLQISDSSGVGQLLLSDPAAGAGLKNRSIYSGGGAMIFGISDDAGTADALQMTIDSAGNVGIGTTTPQSTLQVNGYIQLGSTAVVPPGADCDDAAEEGRMEFNPWTDLLYICSGASGWVTK